MYTIQQNSCTNVTTVRQPVAGHAPHSACVLTEPVTRKSSSACQAMGAKPRGFTVRVLRHHVSHPVRAQTLMA